MRRRLMVCGTLITLVVGGGASGVRPAVAAESPPRTVYEVDLARYVGQWYEIARIPNRFQKKCVQNVTAEYRFREDGRIAVINSCQESDGDVDRAEGVARVRNAPRNTQLQVSFVSLLGKNLFWGDYWIIGLGEEYEYAVIGHPKRKYGWVLSRTPTLSAGTMGRIKALLRDQGYDPEAFSLTKQTPR